MLLICMMVVVALASTSAIQLNELSDDDLNAVLDFVAKRNYQETVVGNDSGDEADFDDLMDKRGRGRFRNKLEKCVNPSNGLLCMCDNKYTDAEPKKRYKVCAYY
ncbi:uncharacterized protein LOC105437518 [Strongylocentrotus purpuratus]|uniref:Uncharacterized protein n=1 Tax=Strongylocentrotus purpuratus TaxID=7668 RepID=A0A7M7HFL0_STRPU|nr:uncharacterized protein LOC105437518 [Strongylocentrotus purpuratus]